VLSAGFEAMASQRLKLMEFSAVDMNSKIGFRSIHVVGEATALFPRPTTDSIASVNPLLHVLTIILKI